MLLSIFKVKGHSMEPLIREGSLLLISSIPLFIIKPRENDIILFKSQGKTIVKRIVGKEKNTYFVEGDNKSDSKKFGAISRADMLGRVILKI